MRSKGYVTGLSLAAFLALSPIVIAPAAAEECVRTVRAISDFTIQGDAWLWWDRAAGRYERDRRPALGSVLVFKRSGRLNRGHVSLVSGVIDQRTIEVDHSWLDGRGLRRNMRVVDVSPRNDWSAVRVWHEPSAQMGLRVYAAYGLILPEGQGSHGRVMEADASGIDTGFSVTPAGRGGARRAPEAARLVQAASPAAGEAMTATLTVAVPGRKPQLIPASFTPAPARAAAPVDAVLPRRKPAAPAEKGMVASVDGLRTALPGRKPGTGTVAELVAE